MDQKYRIDEFILAELFGNKLSIQELKTICKNRNILSDTEDALERLLSEMEKKGLVGKTGEQYFAKMSVKEYQNSNLVNVAQAMKNNGSMDRMFFTPMGTGGNRPFD